MKKRLIIAVLAPISVLALAGCHTGAQASKGFGDAGINEQNINRTPVQELEFSDGWPNIEFKCNGKDGVYTNDRSAGDFVVIPNDPSCTG